MEKPWGVQQLRREQLAECHAEKVVHRALLGWIEGPRRGRPTQSRRARPALLQGHADKRPAENRFEHRRSAVTKIVLAIWSTDRYSRPQNVVPARSELGDAIGNSALWELVAFVRDPHDGYASRRWDSLRLPLIRSPLRPLSKKPPRWLGPSRASCWESASRSEIVTASGGQRGSVSRPSPASRYAGPHGR